MKTWTDKVKNIYSSIEELKSYDEMYGIVAKCGFESVQEMWDKNPTIGGSINPKDFGIVEVYK